MQGCTTCTLAPGFLWGTAEHGTPVGPIVHVLKPGWYTTCAITTGFAWAVNLLRIWPPIPPNWSKTYHPVCMEAHSGSDLTSSEPKLVTHLPLRAGTWSLVNQFPFPRGSDWSQIIQFRIWPGLRLTTSTVNLVPN